MPEEISSIKDLMVINREKNIAGRTYSEGTIDNTEVVVVFSRWGKVASACTTTTLINEFDVDFILFTGVAGAIGRDLNIGDIIIANGLYQHDMDARPFFDQFQIPLTSTIVFKPRASDIAIGIEAAKIFINNIENTLDQNILKTYSISNPMVYTGYIASGDKFISNPTEHTDLTLGNTLAVEMEGAAVAQVCEDHNIPYLVIRVISDKADHSAPIDFQLFISKIASKYAYEIVKQYIKIYQCLS